MLETFKERLKAKSTAAGANLSQKRIDAIADRLHKNFPELTEEKDHDEKLDELNEISPFKEIAALDDYQRTKEAREAKAKADKEKADKAKKDKIDSDKSDDNPGEEEKQKADEMPAWFKPYAEKVDKIEKKEQEQTLSQKLSSHPKLDGIPEVFWKKRVLPKSDEEIDAFAEEAATDYGTIAPIAEGALRPAGGKGAMANTKQATKEELEKIFPK